MAPTAEVDPEEGEEETDSVSASGGEKSSNDPFSESSSDFDDSSPQCRIRDRRSGSIIRYSPAEFSQAASVPENHDEIRVPIPTNTTYPKAKFGISVKTAEKV